MTLDPATQKLCELARESLVDEGDSDAVATSERELLAKWRVSTRSTSRNHRVAYLVAAVAACFVFALSLGFFALRTTSSQSLAVHIDGAPNANAEYVRAPENGAPATMVFSDGTRVVVVPGASARIVERAPNGAQIAVERGSIHCEVASALHANWLFKGGPFAVEVHGTIFDLTWNPETDEFSVDLHQGAVTVRGPFGEGVALKSGQRLSATRTSVRIDPIVIGTSSATIGAPEAAASPTSDTMSAPSATPTSRVTSSTALSWSKLLSEGRSADVVRLADLAGIDNCLATRPESDLTALADSARYEHRIDLAKRAYLAIRGRFASLGSARDAAFFLGRIAESNSQSESANWYARYRAESPSGTYAHEALGREMVLRDSLDPESAKPLATQYLARFPDGPFAHSAATIVSRK